MKLYAGANLMQRPSRFEGGEHGVCVAALFDADADAARGGACAEFDVFGDRARFATELKGGEADPVHGCVRIGRAGVEGLSEDEDRLAMGIVLAAGLGEINVSGEDSVPGHLLPDEVEGIGRTPEVSARGSEGVSVRHAAIDQGAAGPDGANVGIALKKTAISLARRRRRQQKECAGKCEEAAVCKAARHGGTSPWLRSGARFSNQENYIPRLG